MEQSKLFVSTLRESPADAEVISHQLMLRAGIIRQTAAGVYTYMPMGRRILRKVEQIIREEMDAAGCQELLMPTLQPVELWKESGRYSVYGPELMRIFDRHDREFALGPTHEEVITTLVQNEINSYRRLPITLYQIQTKFRDERRPRYGLLRCREFLMKDAYSFDTDWDGLDQTYWQMYNAYNQIFKRCDLNYRAVEADAGAIGGEGETHEFMAIADIGEDTIVSCTSCDYAANLEKAESGVKNNEEEKTTNYGALEKIQTPTIRSIEQLVHFLKVEPADIIKTLIVIADNQTVAVVVRGDHEINEIKIKNYLGAENITMADSETVETHIGVPVGFIGPTGLKIPILVDYAVAHMSVGIAGANELDYHYRNVMPQRDIDLTHVSDFRNIVEGDRCPRCNEGDLAFNRGIEIGHVFKLGTKYSDKLGATFLNPSGSAQPMIMGCYGIGVSRILSAVVEQKHDENGMIWPIAIAPYHVHLIPISTKSEEQMQVVHNLYQRFTKHKIEVLIDDRDERPGVKFKDSDLFGIPVRIVVGKDAEQGNVEFVERRNNEKQLCTAEEAFQRVIRMIEQSTS